MTLRIRIDPNDALTMRTGQFTATVVYNYDVFNTDTSSVVVPAQGPFTTHVRADSLATYRAAIVGHALEQERKRREAARVWSTPAALLTPFASDIEEDTADDPLG